MYEIKIVEVETVITAEKHELYTSIREPISFLADNIINYTQSSEYIEIEFTQDTVDFDWSVFNEIGSMNLEIEVSADNSCKKILRISNHKKLRYVRPENIVYIREIPEDELESFLLIKQINESDEILKDPKYGSFKEAFYFYERLHRN